MGCLTEYEPWCLEDLNITQTGREGEPECWNITCGGGQQPKYQIIAGDLEAAVMDLVRQVTADAIGCLQWTDFRTGKVRRWNVRIGDRLDRITVEAPGHPPSKSHGWTWFLTQLRKHVL